MEISNEYKVWVRRLFFYFAIYIAVVLISHFVFLKFNLLHTDVDSARYMLSALIQSEAAIIAIVVTMSLVATQLATTSYSVRAIDIFRKAPDLWILLLIYGFVLFWGLGVLKLIEKANPSCASDLICQSNLQGHIAITYSLGIFAFVALAPYIWYMMGLLRPSTIINILAKDIIKENIINKEAVNENDPMLAIIDIVNGSLIKSDYVTFKTGLNAIEDCMAIILNDKNFNVHEQRKIANYVFNHLAQVGKLALSRGDEYSFVQLITKIQKIGCIAAQNQLDTVTSDAIIELTSIGIEAVNRNLKWSIEVAAWSLVKIGKISIENGCKIKSKDGGSREVHGLENIVIQAIKHKLENDAKIVASFLGLVVLDAAKLNQSVTISMAIRSLESICGSAIDNGLYEVMEYTSKSLYEMRKEIPPEFESVHKQAENTWDKIIEDIRKYRESLEPTYQKKYFGNN